MKAPCLLQPPSRTQPDTAAWHYQHMPVLSCCVLCILWARIASFIWTARCGATRSSSAPVPCMLVVRLQVMLWLAHEAGRPDQMPMSIVPDIGPLQIEHPGDAR
jgi:hypothetical protein